jgi:hypothetical protein
MWVVDMRNGQVLQKKTSQGGRHYFGHGVYDPSGRLLYVTENAYEEGCGVIGLYDVTDNYKRIGEIPSHGVGPHELKMMTDGKTLVIANGGIRTHPDSERSKLNTDDMDPNLAYVDAVSGQLLGLYRPPAQWHQLSIRHLDITPDNKVAVAMQYQGPINEHPPLIALHQGEDQLQLLTAPQDIQQRMRNYCGSVTCDRSGQLFAVSSPPGNLLIFWSAVDGTGNGQFYASNGQGNIMTITDSTQQREADHDWSNWHWDNHMVAF